MRDLNLIQNKLKQVFIPSGESASLNDWDLWGPLLLCLVLAITLSLKSSSQAETVFTAVFVIVWCGAAIVTVNSKLLGGKLSFLQSVCILGYCLFPLVAASLLSVIFSFFWARISFSLLGFGWAVYASIGFLSDSSLPNRKALAVYPIFLFYFFISWVILISHSNNTPSIAPKPTS
ncbi:hypothetical protein DSO57_1000963 [Entomophthora muscae]|uniref:Uncharacterized protein n=1 Tax=Entomophthora muscae TaxID=34485 RepID=A0ACC2UIQ8_9FUNG|nr:hypothetical protein DSO57_1000963 [Entomophthora muscae]